MGGREGGRANEWVGGTVAAVAEGRRGREFVCRAGVEGTPPWHGTSYPPHRCTAAFYALLYCPCAAAFKFKAMASELEAEAEVEEAGGAPPDIPTKVVSSPINVTVRARILMFDFDGRSGGC